MKTMYKELLLAALKTAQDARSKDKTKKGKAEWDRLIKMCLKESNAKHGRII